MSSERNELNLSYVAYKHPICELLVNVYGITSGRNTKKLQSLEGRTICTRGSVLRWGVYTTLMNSLRYNLGRPTVIVCIVQHP